jgi:proprotein convertase subtilisin/kexin type 2
MKNLRQLNKINNICFSYQGSLYVWASGDGGANDDCNCDGYAASMWTISINSAINDGRTALYDESCSSTLASTFSNGRSDDPEAG